LTVAAIVGVSVYLGVTAVDDTEKTAQREKLILTAQTVADHVDDVLVRTMSREEHMATMVSNAWSRGEPSLTNLLNSYPRFLFESDLYLVRPQGELVWSMRPDTSTPVGGFAEPVATSLESLEGTAGPCSSSAAQDGSLACFASPVLLGDGEPAGALLAQIDLTGPDLNLLSLGQLNESIRIELVAADGLILAGNETHAGELSVHAEVLSRLQLSPPRRIADPADDIGVESAHGSHSVAYAPISTVKGWGVFVEPKDGATLPVAGGTQQRLWLFALAALPVSLALVWLGTRQLLRPLNLLAARAADMSEGDLSTPVAVARRDEVGALAQVLDGLRGTLNDALTDAQHVDDARRESVTRGRLLDGLFQRQEEERRRIAHDLHEGTLQSLSALALGLDSLTNDLESGDQTTRERLTRSRTLALALMQDLRRLAVDLRPPALNDLGLGPALRSYAESNLSDGDTKISFHNSAVETRASPIVEASVYRIGQAAIDNITAHAQAKTVRIELKCEGHTLTLAIEDDGKGFDPADVLADPRAVRGLGILSMRERSALLGGTFTIESSAGQGTRVCTEVSFNDMGEKQPEVR
jgi:signal transduction histidine kinase